MKTFVTAVCAVAASFVLSWFGEIYSHPVPHLALPSGADCAALSRSGPRSQPPCRRQTPNDTTSSSHPGEHQ
ncbi:hypothetical protein [Roseateles violae]|uniref:Secreted protein n=1 Tax=Roseateles violae TaxID=3058042 RepID=A0ABT8DZE8_9BURK|nr:hypothetical protein [Pelomonas sp. PFR6]MDN3922933.1 hypothetical protein [Pelomonas sp. PFR6]